MHEHLTTISPTALAKLFELHGSGLTEAQLSQTRATLGSLHVAPLVFQPRNMDEKSWEKKRHISNLAKAVKDPAGLLDPIIVFPVAGMRVIVDGHCRRDSYVEAKRKTSALIPVKHLRGTFAEALSYSASSNSKDKLALSYFEKSEHAWRLVKFNEGRDCYTGRGISRATGIGKTTVFRMHERLSRSDAAEVRELRWADVLRKDRGAENKEYDDDWETKTAQEWAERLRKAFGDKPNSQPDVFRKALELAYQWEVTRGDDWDTSDSLAGEPAGTPCDF